MLARGRVSELAIEVVQTKGFGYYCQLFDLYIQAVHWMHRAVRATDPVQSRMSEMMASLMASALRREGAARTDLAVGRDGVLERSGGLAAGMAGVGG